MSINSFADLLLWFDAISSTSSRLGIVLNLPFKVLKSLYFTVLILCDTPSLSIASGS